MAHRPQHVGRRLRRSFPPTSYADTGKTFEQAMADAYRAYGEEQARLIEQYYTAPPTEPPPTQPPGGDIPLPPGVGDVIFDDPMTSFDSSRWCRQIGDPKWGLWPGGLPDSDINWQNPDESISSMGPGNNWEWFSPDMVAWGPDGCTLTAVRDSKYSAYGLEYKSGIIRSKQVCKGGGFFRAVCQMADGSGAWDGCWMICDDGSAWEPDLIETGFTPYAEGANASTSAATTFHYAGGSGGPEGSQQSQVRYNAGDMVNQYRTWDCLYRQGEGTTYWLDGRETHHVPDGHACGFAVLINNSVASPQAADWHNQVEDERQDFVVRIRRVLLCNVA